MTKYTSLDQLPITLSANQVAQVLGISRANAYTLMHVKGFPTIQIGKRMVGPKNKLIEWLSAQTASYVKGPLLQVALQQGVTMDRYYAV